MPSLRVSIGVGIVLAVLFVVVLFVVFFLWLISNQNVDRPGAIRRIEIEEF